MILLPIVLRIEDYETEIVIEKGLKLRRITDTELKEFFGVRIEFNKIDRARATYFLKTKVKKISSWELFYQPLGRPSIVSTPFTPHPRYIIEAQNIEALHKFIFLLRVIKPQNFFAPIAVEDYMYHIFYPIQTSNKIDYSILTTELINLSNLLFKMKNIDKQKFEIVSDRFLKALDLNIGRKIRFIEFVSIIESIVCGSEKEEKRYKFSLYASYILTKNGFEISFTKMKRFYDIRSDLIHSGNSNKLNDADVSELSIMVRLIIKYFIEYSLSQKNIEIDILKTLNINS